MPITMMGEYALSEWTNLTLQSGWTARSGTGTTLPPVSWCLTGTTVQLRGEIVPPGVLAGNLLIATLPSEACPPYQYVFSTAILGLIGAGGIRVYPNGEIRLEGVTGLTALTLNNCRFTLRL